jgi:hypothetical protein
MKPYRELVEKMAIRLQSAPTEAELFKAINEYEGYENIASKLWSKAINMTGKKDLLYPDQIETMILELDTVYKDALQWRTRLVEAPIISKPQVIPESQQTPLETRLTTFKRIYKWVSDFISSLPIKK